MKITRLTVLFTLAFSITSTAFAFTRLPVTAENGMVVTSQHIASDVGVAIMRQGGNAIDAAVAVGYALAVTNPCCGNIGGVGAVFFGQRSREPRTDGFGVGDNPRDRLTQNRRQFASERRRRRCLVG